MALNFLKFDPKLNQEQIEIFRNALSETIDKDPFGVILIQRGMGLGYDATIVSLHKNYSSYDAFRNYVRASMGQSITEMNPFLINLEEEKSTLPLNFAFLAIQLLKSNGKSKNRNNNLML